VARELAAKLFVRLTGLEKAAKIKPVKSRAHTVNACLTRVAAVQQQNSAVQSVLLTKPAELIVLRVKSLSVARLARKRKRIAAAAAAVTAQEARRAQLSGGGSGAGGGKRKNAKKVQQQHQQHQQQQQQQRQYCAASTQGVTSPPPWLLG
jgi:hypothetical protein